MILDEIPMYMPSLGKRPEEIDKLFRERQAVRLDNYLRREQKKLALRLRRSIKLIQQRYPDLSGTYTISEQGLISKDEKCNDFLSGLSDTNQLVCRIKEYEGLFKVYHLPSISFEI